jgi:hypothetical protein
MAHFMTLSLMLLAFLMPGDVLAQTGALNKDPAALVKKYLELDSKGARLHALTREAQQPYVAWKDEPVWGHIVVISRYDVVADTAQWEIKNNLDVVIPVEFRVIGSLYLEEPTFLSERQTERIGFRVKAVNGLWRLVEPMLPPHVGHKRAVNFVREAMVEESDAIRMAALTSVRDELKRAR